MWHAGVCLRAELYAVFKVSYGDLLHVCGLSVPVALNVKKMFTTNKSMECLRCFYHGSYDPLKRILSMLYFVFPVPFDGKSDICEANQQKVLCIRAMQRNHFVFDGKYEICEANQQHSSLHSNVKGNLCVSVYIYSLA